MIMVEAVQTNNYLLQNLAILKNRAAESLGDAAAIKASIIALRCTIKNNYSLIIEQGENSFLKILDNLTCILDGIDSLDFDIGKLTHKENIAFESIFSNFEELWNLINNLAAEAHYTVPVSILTRVDRVLQTVDLTAFANLPARYLRDSEHRSSQDKLISWDQFTNNNRASREMAERILNDIALMNNIDEIPRNFVWFLNRNKESLKRYLVEKKSPWAHETEAMAVVAQQQFWNMVAPADDNRKEFLTKLISSNGYTFALSLNRSLHLIATRLPLEAKNPFIANVTKELIFIIDYFKRPEEKRMGDGLEKIKTKKIISVLTDVVEMQKLNQNIGLKPIRRPSYWIPDVIRGVPLVIEDLLDKIFKAKG